LYYYTLYFLKKIICYSFRSDGPQTMQMILIVDN